MTGAAPTDLRAEGPHEAPTSQDEAPPIAVVGIGEDGWAGLTEPARAALRAARRVLGSARQLALLPTDEVPGAAREAWPTPMRPRIEALAAAVTAGDPAARAIVVLGSGDPMLHGIGATLAQLVGSADLRVIPAPSAFSLACARLGWAMHEVPLVSLVADVGTDVLPALAAGRAIVYVPGAYGAALLAGRLRAAGLADARLTILERLGGPAERRISATAAEVNGPYDPLHLVAVECAPAGAAVDRLASPVPGLPDAAFQSDGQLTRSDVRAVALASLAPRSGELLWDVGAGTGTIAVEWCRAASATRAIAIERHPDRCEHVAANAEALGAGGRVMVVEGAVPQALDGLAQPNAIYVGGATSQPGLLDRCWAALAPGGRLVAAAVTLESEQALLDAHRRLGGRVVRLEHSHLEPLGGFTAWRPERPITQWAVTKPHPEARSAA